MMPSPPALTWVTRGASGSLDSQTVTNGTTSTGSDPYYNWAGYKSASPAIGSIADGTSNLYSGASILGVYFYEQFNVSPPDGYVVRQVVLEINGTRANSGWATMTVGTTVYNRADATFSAGATTTWTWSVAIPNQWVSGSPGDFSGGTTAVVFA